ncbi:hypothetical protein [Marinomonas rhizomae]|uniref:hypothetical protein n=1 Tax=Marinomonas rhizomae TaxID=491948 RepID=UPI001314E2C0|nr:hypothetical protein [Marinomonas rhizomae]
MAKLNEMAASMDTMIIKIRQLSTQILSEMPHGQEKMHQGVTQIEGDVTHLAS